MAIVIGVLAVSSSPHAWGTRESKAQCPSLNRFIPTCVGNSIRVSTQLHQSTVHPHMRGELCGSLSWLSPPYGSSPHAWGTHLISFTFPYPHRFIPTCVGNSTPHLARLRECPVHPHMRGELSVVSLTILTEIGSSPHAWGTQHPLCVSCDDVRFIPTCVGNSILTFSIEDRDSVHPHMRGELSGSVSVSSCVLGSSPHAWGTRPFQFLDFRTVRFIPTCVGNSPRA